MTRQTGGFQYYTAPKLVWMLAAVGATCLVVGLALVPFAGKTPGFALGIIGFASWALAALLDTLL